MQPGLPKLISGTFSWLHKLFFNKWFFDEIYNFVFVRSSLALGRFFWVRGDQKTIDRFGPDGTAALSQRVAHVLSRFQSGYVYQYAFVMMIAVIGIVSWFAFRYGQGL